MSAIKKICFYLAFLLPATVLIGFYAGGLWNWLTPFVVFILLPLADYFVGIDTKNIAQTETKVIGEELYYRFITFM